MTTRIKLRRDTAANWEDINPVLALGEAGYDSTNNALRIGDGTSHWVDLAPIAASTSGNILLSENESYQLTLNNNGWLGGGSGGEYDVKIGQDPDNSNTRAHITISQDNPYIRSEVISTTNQNYQNDMMWHDSWFSRYSKVTADAYGVQIKNAQWNGPANEYQNIWTFTKDGILDLPPRAEIRANPRVQGYGEDTGGGASYDNVPNDNADQSLTLTANSVMISGGRLDVGGGAREGFVSVLGPYPNNDDDYWYEATCADETGNIYAAGGTYSDNHSTIVTKFLANGYVAWNKYIDYDGTPWGGEPNSITYNGLTGKVIVTTNNYNGDVTVARFDLDPFTGAVTDNQTIASTGTGIEATDVTMPNWQNGDPIIVGRQDSGQAYFTPDLTGVNTQSGSPRRLIVNSATFEGNLQPDASQGTWYMYGTGITGNVAINQVNQFDYRIATRTSGSGTGTNAQFYVSYTPGGAYTVSVQTGGSNYANDDVLKITGDYLGGATPANDVTFHVVTDAGGITSVNTVTGTATTKWALGLTGNPVDFTVIATPTIRTTTGTDGWLVWNESQYMLGNVSWDQINSVAVESNQTDGNVYIGGVCHADAGNGYQIAFVAKVNMDGGDIQWARAVDDYHAQGGTNSGGVVNGVVCDTNNAVISVADNNNSEITITKVDKDGTMVWQRNLAPYSNLQNTYGITLGDDNSVLITAQARAYQEQSNNDLLITKIDTDGNQVWTRMFGTMQSDGAYWEYNPRNITTAGDYYLLNGWTNGVANQRTSNSNGFVAKLPLDGTGVGRYGDFYYSQIDGGTDFYTVGNTTARAIPLPWRDASVTNSEFTFGSLSDISSANENTSTLRVKTGGPGVIQGVNDIRFANGSTISNTEEEGLIIWQPDNGGDNAEYVGLAYGGTAGNGPDFQPNIMISAGTDLYGQDDSDLENYNFDNDGQRQVNIDIIGRRHGGENYTNFSNWHFDEDGSMYLPAQGYYYYDGINIEDTADLGNGLTTYYFNKTDYPTLVQDIQAGDKAFSPVNSGNWAPVYEFGTVDAGNCYVTLSSTFSPDVPAIGFTSARRNGIVYPDGSKQIAGGSKYIPGYGGDLSQGKTYSYTSNSTERLIWTSSNSNVNAFRGTFRCQLGDPSEAIKIYDIAGSYYTANGGETGYSATPILDNYWTAYNAVTFNLTKEEDGHLRLYATPPQGYSGTVFITSDVTEFGYTQD